MFKKLFSLVALSQLSLLASAQTITGQYDCLPAGNYQLCQNLWGEDAGSGSQSSTLNSANGDSVSWSTTWSWTGGENNVKSYPNLASNTAKGKQLSSIGSAPTSWSWNYQSNNNVRADVSYDIWLGNAQSGDPASSASSYEIMIWLSGQGGIQPVGSQVTTGINLAGHNWNLWKGPNQNWQVLSFVSADGDITNFDADLKEFFDYLVQNQGVASSQYVQSIQSGTEPFTGSATLVINNYSVALN
ncbi:hypothetical protein NP233_g4312 [Leucocoprinus birnbaumii]|uniref:Uncharacterized protein n=1 Tax=Leucocoprinus birnbaumii TaxID=56174 RepID=A0AAD5VM46_9AGAR|nr:hypothetical protein NP233_g8552 [Leucocoprinus birnbaumii]KAJ3570569.1 hypothetical protein NP233_g4312 [Leucocoprinus birnbaumii]